MSISLSSFTFVGKCSSDFLSAPPSSSLSPPRSFRFSNRAFSRLALTLCNTVSSSSSSSLLLLSSSSLLFRSKKASSSSSSSSSPFPNPMRKCFLFNPDSKSFNKSNGSLPSNPNPALVKLPRINPIASVTFPCRHFSSLSCDLRTRSCFSNHRTRLVNVSMVIKSSLMTFLFTRFCVSMTRMARFQ